MNIQRLIQIGHEIAGINSAIEEGRVGFTNAGGVRGDYYATQLFRRLSGHREILRREILALGGDDK